jgi:hypothetical protein
MWKPTVGTMPACREASRIRAQLLGSLPAAVFISPEQQVARRARGDDRLDEFGRFAGQRDVSHAPAFALPNGQRFDIRIVVGHPESAELTVAAAGQQGAMDEIAECTLAGIEQARDLVLRKITDDRGVDRPERLHAPPSVIRWHRPGPPSMI